MYCKKCGNNLDEDAIFCTKCGDAIVSKEIINREPSKQEEQKNFEHTEHEKINANPTPLPASSTRRFINYLLDRIFIYALFSLIAGIAIFEISGTGNSSSSAPASDSFGLIFYIILFGICCAYYSLFETIWGKTPAKFITKTKVVNQNGGEPDSKSIIIRTLCRFIPFEAFSFFGNRPVGWHDSISKTIVIKEGEIIKRDDK